jgi:hypothetical protein
MNRHEGPLPVPFADGSVPQTIVHYLGQCQGAMAWTGRASGRRYPFDARDCCHYIPDEDLELFRLLAEFDVLDNDDSQIDLAREQASAEREQLKEELRQELMSDLASRPSQLRRASNGSLGRRRGGGFGAFLDCLMDCCGLRDVYGSVASAYDAIAERLNRLPEWSGRVPPRENFPNLCSHGRALRLARGGCTWHRHPEPWPAQWSERPINSQIG